MAKIYRRSDRIKIQVEDLVIKVRPLSIHEKMEIQQLQVEGAKKNDIVKMMKGLALSIKYAVCAIEGIIDAHGEPYVLAFEEGFLTDECVEDLLNMEVTSKIGTICSELAQKIPTEFKIDGVKIIEVESEKKK